MIVTHIKNIDSGDVVIQKKSKLGLPCNSGKACHSGYCKLGTCRSRTAGCYDDSYCQSGYKCSQPRDKIDPGYCEKK